MAACCPYNCRLPAVGAALLPPGFPTQCFPENLGVVGYYTCVPADSARWACGHPARRSSTCGYLWVLSIFHASGVVQPATNTAAANRLDAPDAAAWWQPLRGVRQALHRVQALWPQARRGRGLRGWEASQRRRIVKCPHCHAQPMSQISMLWKPVFLVELLVAAVVVPMQFASLLVVTLPLTLPLILDLQASAPAAVIEGT